MELIASGHLLGTHFSFSAHEGLFGGDCHVVRYVETWEPRLWDLSIASLLKRRQVFRIRSTSSSQSKTLKPSVNVFLWLLHYDTMKWLELWFLGPSSPLSNKFSIFKNIIEQRWGLSIQTSVIQGSRFFWSDFKNKQNKGTNWQVVDFLKIRSCSFVHVWVGEEWVEECLPLVKDLWKQSPLLLLLWDGALVLLSNAVVVLSESLVWLNMLSKRCAVCIPEHRALRTAKKLFVFSWHVYSHAGSSEKLRNFAESSVYRDHAQIIR